LWGEEEKITMSHTRRWDMDNPNEQIRDANKELRTRLMGIVTQRNLNAQLPKGDSSSISEVVDMLITNGAIPAEGRSKEFAEVITNMGVRVDRGEIITPVEFGNGNYTTAVEWFDDLEGMQRQKKDSNGSDNMVPTATNTSSPS
jgi:hypothetical protein